MAVPPWRGTSCGAPEHPGGDAWDPETTPKGSFAPSLPHVPWDVGSRLLSSPHLHPLRRLVLWSSPGCALGLTWLSLVTSTGHCIYFWHLNTSPDSESNYFCFLLALGKFCYSSSAEI